MSNNIYIVSIIKHSLSVTTKTIIGYATSNNKNNIDSYLKEKYDLILGEELEYCSILKDSNWVYSTNKSNVLIHIESVSEIK